LAQTANPENVTYTPANNFTGVVTLTLTTNAPGTCPANSDTRTINVELAPTVEAGGPDDICQSATPGSIALSGASVGGSATTGAWSITSGGGTLSSTAQTANPQNVTYTPAVNFSGIVTLTLTTNDPANSCSAISDTRTINVSNEATVDAGTDQTICETGTAVMAATIGGGASSGTWSTSGTGSFNNNSTTAIYTPSAADAIAGTVILTYTTNDPIGPCPAVSDDVEITIIPDLGDALLDGFAWDQNIPRQMGPISSEIIACHQGDGTLTLHIDSAYIPFIQGWEYNTGSGFTAAPSDGDPDSNILTYDFTGLIGLTSYRVVFSTGGTCGNAGYSSVAYVSVIPPDLEPEPVTANPTEFCYGDTSSMSASTSYGVEQLNQEGGFDQGQLNTTDPNGWLVDGELGKLSASANSENPNNWSVTNDGKTFNGILYDNDDPGPPSTNEGKFGIANGYYNVTGVGGHPVIYNSDGDRITTLETPIFSLMDLQNATLDFREAYNITGPQAACYTDETMTTTEPAPAAEIIIEISLDGGVTYTEFLRPTITGPADSGAGSYTDFNDVSLDLSDYFGQTNLRIRFTLVRNCTSTWAIDGITLPGSGGGSTVIWTDQWSSIVSTSNTFAYQPITPGYQIYTVTTLINGCAGGSEDVPLTVDYAYAGVDQTVSGGCGAPAQLHAYDNTKKARLNAQELQTSGNWTPGLYTVPTSDAFDYAGTGATGEWSITSGPAVAGIPDWTLEDPANYFFPSIYDPRAEFGGPSGQYELTWTVHGIGGDCSDSVIINLSSCATLDFDGIDDNVTFRNDFDLDAGPFSIEIWVKPDPTTNSGGPNDAFQTILSKRDASTYVDGYDLSLVGNKIYFNWNSGLSFTHTNTISTNRWYHVAVTYDGTTNYKMYIDGIELGSASGPPPIANNFECIMGAMDQSAGGGNPTPLYYYSGWLDELRIWNVELSVNQIRHMMNQEIIDNGGNVQGAVIPIDIPGPPAALTWANLDGYYRMNQGTDVANGYLLANAGTRDGQMRNITTWQLENSPLPYETDNTGNWYDTASDATSPWLWGHTVWDYPNAIGIDGTTRIDWNIVRTYHDVESDLTSTSPRDITVLGLLVEPNSELTITAQGTQDETNTGHGLWVTHYLDLDGSIDLIGESQLVQKRYFANQVNESLLEVDSEGFLERDQQGTVNFYNYNYWASPVSGWPNTSANNADYSILSVLRDGSDSNNPLPITPITGSVNGDILELSTYSLGGDGITPIGLNDYWQFYYINQPIGDYYSWVSVGLNGMIPVGNGYTMKGSGVGQTIGTPLLGTQNYVFIGKPHNNTIDTQVGPNRAAVIGNPYPSAIDSREFILDNIPGGNPGSTGSTTGTIYFWEHYTLNKTHITELYEGGYAILNLSGGTPATSHPIISQQGAPTKTPEYHIPVGQGFFVNGASSQNSTNVRFKNSQRIFVREGSVAGQEGSIFVRGTNTKGASAPPPPVGSEEDKIKRVRLNFKAPDGFGRPLLLAFVPDNKATDGFDYGYDAPNTDDFPDDMSFLMEEDPYVIQGVGDFDETKLFPLGLYLANSGKIEVSLTDLENFDNNVKVYIYDSYLGTYTKINIKDYEITLDAADYLDRFYLAFANKNSLSIEDEEILEVNQVIVNYLNETQEIYIKSPNDIEVRQVYLINIVGQTVGSWNITNTPMSQEFTIPVKNVADGNYIIKVESTASESTNKKVIIKH
jgi:hypothetical protein